MQVQQDDKIAKNPVPASLYRTGGAPITPPEGEFLVYHHYLDLSVRLDRSIHPCGCPAFHQKGIRYYGCSGRVLGGIMYLSLALLAIPCGILVDKWRRK